MGKRGAPLAAKCIAPSPTVPRASRVGARP